MPTAIDLERQYHVSTYAVRVAVAAKRMAWRDLARKLSEGGFGPRRSLALFTAIAAPDRALFRVEKRKHVDLLARILGVELAFVAPPVEVVVLRTPQRTVRYLLRPGDAYADEDGRSMRGRWFKRDGKVVLVNARGEELELEARKEAMKP